MFAITKAHIIQFPSGRFGFVGRVPVELAFEYDSIEDVKIAQHSGPGIAGKIAAREGRVFRTRTWDTKEAALHSAHNFGAEG
jgi:glutamate synthase domain-containing protein 2